MHVLEINGYRGFTAAAFHGQNIVEASKSIGHGYFIRRVQYFFAVHDEFVGIFTGGKY